MHTPGAQMRGRWKFQYSLIPHEGGWAQAYAEAHRFVRPMRSVRVSRGSGSLPGAGSLIEIEPPEVILSALKVAEDDGSIIARVYNIGAEAVEARVALRVPFGRVERVDLNEERPQAIPHEDGSVRLNLKTNEIATLKFS
jgi:alpha-mannosidase